MENFPTNQDGAQPVAPSSDNSNPTLAAAMQAAQLGFSVVSVSPSTKRPTAKWEAAQTRAKTPEEVAKLKTLKAFAIVGGAVSGGCSPEGEQLYLTSIDFDVPGFFERYKTDLGDLLDGVSVQKTGGGCYQVIFRSPVEIRNTKLAFAPNDAEETGREIVIETRGEGGYFVAPPSLHPTGNRYEWIEGDLQSVPTISAARAQSLLDAAQRMDGAPYTRQQLEAQQKREQSAKPRQLPNTPSASVIERFNVAHSVEEMLEQHGYKRRGDRYARPGGSSPSVTILDGGSYHHSSNDPLQCNEHTQDAFAVFAYYEHGDDYKSAVKAAAEELGMSLTRNDTNRVMRDDRHGQEQLDEQESVPRWTFTKPSTLRTRPRPLYLIRDILILATAAVLSGDSQSFKTFCALAMALCVATGTPWHGREVRQGAVVYIAAEGGWTLRDRLEAWETAHGITVSDDMFHLLEIPVSFGDRATVKQFADFIKDCKPALVVIDTLSACAEGLKENASEDMATFVRHMKDVATATGATNLVIHHNNKGGDLRGAVSLKNDVDTHLTFARSEREDDLITVISCSKQRGPRFDKFALQGEQIVLSAPDEYGRAVTSLVFEQCEMPDHAMPKKNANGARADATRAQLLELFDGIAARFDGVKTGTWQAEAEGEGISKTAFHRHLKALVEAEEIEKIGDVWHRLNAFVPQVPQVPNGSYGTPGKSVSTPCPTSPTHPLGVGLVGQGKTNAPKTRKTKAKNSADDEFYPAPETTDEMDGDLI